MAFSEKSFPDRHCFDLKKWVKAGFLMTPTLQMTIPSRKVEVLLRDVFRNKNMGDIKTSLDQSSKRGEVFHGFMEGRITGASAIFWQTTENLMVHLVHHGVVLADLEWSQNRGFRVTREYKEA